MGAPSQPEKNLSNKTPESFRRSKSKYLNKIYVKFEIRCKYLGRILKVN